MTTELRLAPGSPKEYQQSDEGPEILFNSAGKIVLSIGCARCADGDDKTFGGYMPTDKYDTVKVALDELHKRKIDLADEVLILNVGGYIGESTASELAHAEKCGKCIRFLETRA